MREREKLIIKSAMKCFAERGYYQTSIQQIADEASMAKGSIYNYFGSKEQLLLEIFQHHYENLFLALEEMDKEQMSARECFEKQLSFIFVDASNKLDFVIMQTREQVAKVNQEIYQYVAGVRKRLFRWYTKRLLDVYGESIHPFSVDLAAMLEGMVREYMFFILVGKKTADIHDLGEFFLVRMDYLVISFKETGDSGRLKQAYIDEPQKQAGNRKQLVKKAIQQIDEIDSTAFLPEDSKKLQRSLLSLREEALKESPNDVVLSGLILYLKTFDQKYLLNKVDSIEEALQQAQLL
ncbi:TetR family transcriptional regulator [Bacillus lacus]|uniref:TetR family transcriptional regulator n=1 Tax=Metabacillus lacus TaxID=1983721 RepID=A0A7X2IY75_9BACI|nr:TetR/AcrR family transcriptional regulator [Metabacillus lacus]MRX71652.1 TetR family transcriptional regulator [Metabacillus lacus]